MRRIAAFVFMAHFLMVAALVFQYWLSHSAKPMHPMVVRTRQFQPEIVSAKQTSPAKQTSFSKAPSNPKPSTAKKPASVTKPATKSAAKKTTAPESCTVAKESKRASLYVPEIHEVSVSSEPADSHSSYASYLVSYLQGSLELPEYGTVRVKLTIDRYGRLMECDILDTQSQKNGTFLKEKIQDLTLPVFSDFGIMDLTQTFTISFRNVEIR